MIVQKESLENEACSYVAEISAILCIYIYMYVYTCRLYVVVLTSHDDLTQLCFIRAL